MKPDKPTFPCDANALRGRQTREWAATVVRARLEAKRAGNEPQSPGGPILIAGRDQVTPPLLTPAERAEGNSTNARLHRLIGKYRDMT